MVILGIETSGAACSVAVLQDAEIASHRRTAMTRGHAEALMPMIEATLADAGLVYDALDRIAVTVGPGSFTGLRTGLAAAKGLAQALGVPLIGVTSFEAVAYAARERDPADRRPIAAALETKRADIYLQLFDADLAALSKPSARPADAPLAVPQAAAIRLAGDAAPRLLSAQQESGLAMEIVSADGPDATAVARLAARRATAPSRPVAPLYLHPPQAKLPAHGGRLRP